MRLPHKQQRGATPLQSPFDFAQGRLVGGYNLVVGKLFIKMIVQMDERGHVVV
jgi:hypothetical protein